MNLFTLLEGAARRWPQAGAVYSGTQCLQNWAQLHDRALRLAAALGSQPGRVAIASENAPQYLELMFGTWAAGGAVVPLNYKLHPREMADIAGDAEPSLLFASPALAPSLRDALPVAWRERVVTIGSVAYEALFESAPAQPGQTAPEALAWLFYTSGTTGRSKGAMLTQRNMMAMTVAHLADVDDLDEGCTQIHVAPMSHGSGLYIPASVARGARQVIPASGSFQPEEFLDLCDAHPGCSSFLAPTMVQRLRIAAQASGRRPRGLRTIVYGGGPMYVEELNKSLAVFGQVFVQIYGQGESPMTITWLRRADHASGDAAVLGSVGTARTGMQVRVVGADGRDLPTGETGEIICSGDAVMAGYWRNTQGTAETLRDGWLHTGDMGSLDQRGYLTLRDRSKDVVISGGSNIYPREVEEALLTHPAVAEVCVVGVPDAEWGEAVVAFVVMADETSVGEPDLDAHCLARIARFKRPKRYVFTDALPKNSYGKVLKRALRDQLITPNGTT